MAKNTKGLGGALEYIKKKYKADDDVLYNPNSAVESVGTGSAIIDSITGVGGFLVKKRLTELAAPESSGKTTLALQSCAQAQKAGWVGVFIDVEQAFDYNYAKKLGVNLDNETFMVVQPTYAEQAEEVINAIISKADIDYLVIDSVAAMKPESQLFAEDSTGKGQLKGAHAMYWSNFSPKLQMLAKENNIAVLVTNQVRRKISMGGMFAAEAVSTSGIGTGFSTDNSWITTGGETLKFYLSMRYLLNVKKQYKIEVGDKKIAVGNIIKISNVKHKLSAPYAKTEFMIRFRQGFGTDDIPLMIDLFKKQGILTATGGNYVLEETDFNPKLSAKGYDNFEALLREKKNLKAVNTLYTELMKVLDIDDSVANSEGSDDGDIILEDEDLDEE